MSGTVNGTEAVLSEKVAILDAGAQYGKVCLHLLYVGSEVLIMHGMAC